MRALLATLLLTLSLPAAHAALVADVNVDHIRTVPEASAIATQLEAVLPAHVHERLAQLAKHFDCDPRRDLHRVVVAIPDDGAPTIRLVGLPAARIAEALSQRGEGVTVLGGLTGYPLPNRPQAVLVALGDQEMLIGRADLLSQISTQPPSLPPVNPQLALHLSLTPPATPRAPIMAYVQHLTLTADGQGHIMIDATAHDAASADAIEKRIGTFRRMVDVGAGDGLPELERAKLLLDAATLTRTDTALHVDVNVPAEVRQHAFNRILARLTERAARQP